VTLNDQLKNIVSDIEATGVHVSQSLATLESNALTIAKINEINPYFGIDKIETSPNDYVIPLHNNNLFEYYKLTCGTQTKAFGVFISPHLSTGNNQSLFHVVKGESYNTVGIGYSDGYSSSRTTITGKLYLVNNYQSTEFLCLSNGIQFTKKDSSDTVIIPYGTDSSDIGAGLTIEKINEINPLLGIDEYYNSPPFNKNEKLFQYYKHIDYFDNTLMEFGVVVQMYHDTYKGYLFNINKKDNSIKIGNDYINSTYDSITQRFIDKVVHETSTEIGGRVIIRNNSGLVLQNSTNSIIQDRLINHENDVSF
jgi:hypothetical protein